ncbi:MAG: GNAT family N-acetyltransferase [Deltaproteobacteria bacterium]|nr:GNAT family N-acetyltransferase [Deltaproteobacteria bacterium]
MRYEIVPLAEKDLGRLKAFTDRAIGAGYYSEAELKDIFNRSSMNGVMCSFLLVLDGSAAADASGEIFGVRFTYPPGNWSHGKGEGLTPDQWPHAKADTAYFQSLFLSDAIQGQGFGSKLSQASIDVLKEIGAKGVVCHSWKESPGGSSTKYLEKMGFQRIKEHPLYWQHVDYNCTRCLKPPCQCTAIEMYYEIPREK